MFKEINDKDREYKKGYKLNPFTEEVLESVGDDSDAIEDHLEREIDKRQGEWSAINREDLEPNIEVNVTKKEPQSVSSKHDLLLNCSDLKESLVNLIIYDSGLKVNTKIDEECEKQEVNEVIESNSNIEGVSI